MVRFTLTILTAKKRWSLKIVANKWLVKSMGFPSKNVLWYDVLIVYSHVSHLHSSKKRGIYVLY